MKDIKEFNRLVIIYSPLGKEHKYCTKDLGKEKNGEREYELALTIEAEPGLVKVGLKEDGKTIVRGYSMPYYFELF
jgi:hypothetical protein